MHQTNLKNPYTSWPLLEVKKNKKNNRNYFIADSLGNSPITFEAEVMLAMEEKLSLQEQRDIENWLFYKSNYRKLYIDAADGVLGETYDIVAGREVPYYLNCRFVNPAKIIGNGGVVGYRFNVECDSYLMWQDPIVKEFNVSGGEAIIKLNVRSDTENYIYPKVTFTMGNAGGDIRIINHSDDSARLTTFKALSPIIEFRMNSELNYISGDNYIKFYDKNFIRLLPGENSISVTGDVAKIKFEWSNRRYL